MQGYRPSTYGDAFADVYDEWYPAGEDVARVVEALARLAGAGPVLELGCGTGRLCLPLVGQGLKIVGLDASQAMLDRLGAKLTAMQRGSAHAGAVGQSGRPAADPSNGVVGQAPPALSERSNGPLATATMTAIHGDMADFDLSAHGPFELVFSAFNTLFNLPTPESQASCFRAVAGHLSPSGRFAVECFVPGDGAQSPDAIELRALSAERVVLRVSRHDPNHQTVSGQHIELTESHGVRLRPWHLRYATPAQLDHLAAAAGLELAERWSDWSGAPFGEDSTQHVSVYRPRP